MLGVQTSSPASPALANARTSVLMAVATSWISSSSNAADMVMALANDVAALNCVPVKLKLTPGDAASPCSASLHHSYAGSPILGAPALALGWIACQ